MRLILDYIGYTITFALIGFFLFVLAPIAFG